jgi:hypothetical protein
MATASIALDYPLCPFPTLGVLSAAVGAAMPIHPFLQPGAFGPEVTAAMSEAFEAACNELNAAGQPKVAPDVIAGRIIAAARSGERDPSRLRAAALAPGEED